MTVIAGGVSNALHNDGGSGFLELHNKMTIMRTCSTVQVQYTLPTMRGTNHTVQTQPFLTHFQTTIHT